MGLLTAFRQPAPTVVTAAAEPITLEPAYWSDASAVIRVSRRAALTVPAVARARGIICGTIGTLPLDRWANNGNRRLSPIPLQYQPDPTLPRSVTYAYIADSLFFYGGAYVQVLETYSDGRVSRFRWVDPLRVAPITDKNRIVIGFTLDGSATPRSGVGAIISIPAMDEGLLARAGRTIETAISLENAANNAAKEPVPQMLLKNKGMELGAAKVKEILAAWKTARQTRSTGWINADVDAQVLGFDAKSQQLVEARQFHASEIARAAGIPAWYLNAEMASATYTNVESERRSLNDFSLRNYYVPIEERLSMGDFLARDLSLRFDLDDFLRGATKERVDSAISLYQAEIISLDEARYLADIELGETGE